jgi:Uma2 family endonuclease
MSAATVFPLMTVKEFDALPEPKGDYTYELHFGRLVRVSKPKYRPHYTLQLVIQSMLQQALNLQAWLVGTEMPYTLAEGYDVRAADVGVVSLARDKQVPAGGDLLGAPELVVFVKSRSNRDIQIEREAVECLTHGALAVWYVKHNPKQMVTVYTAAGRKEYGPGQSIPLPASMRGRIKVKDIFTRI